MEGYEKEPENMCEVINRAINDRINKKVNEKLAERRVKEREKEREKGRVEGRVEIQKEMAAKLRKKGWNDEEIADFLDVEVVDVRIWLDSAEA